MSIQSSINQGMTIAGALYTQTPGYQAKVQEKKDLQEIERLKSQKDIISTRFANEAMGLDEKALEGLEKKQKELIDPIEKRLSELGDEETIKLIADREALNSHIAGMEEANMKAEAKKQAKFEQMNKVTNKRKSYLDLETSLGGTLRDLKLSPEQKAAVKAQLKENK